MGDRLGIHNAVDILPEADNKKIEQTRNIRHFSIALVVVSKTVRVLINDSLSLVGKWADPGGTAMPGQLVTEPEQAPELYPLTKISLISKRAHGPRIRY